MILLLPYLLYFVYVYICFKLASRICKKITGSLCRGMTQQTDDDLLYKTEERLKEQHHRAGERGPTQYTPETSEQTGLGPVTRLV